MIQHFTVIHADISNWMQHTEQLQSTHYGFTYSSIMKQHTPQNINKMKKRYYKKLSIKTEYVHENSGYQ